MSTRRFKPGFIDDETDYTRGNVVPGAAPVLAEESAGGDEATAAVLDEAPAIAAEPTPRRARRRSPGRDDGSKADLLADEGAEPDLCRCIVRFSLDADTTDRLEAVAREVGQEPAVILGQLRKGVVTRLHQLIADGRRPGDKATEGGGAKVRVNFTLAGEEYARAKSWFDPLSIGDHAMRENMVPTLARLYRDRIRELGPT